MGRRKREEHNIRTLNKNGGGSVSVTLPINEIRDLKWRDGQKVVVKRTSEGFKIEDWKK